MTRLFRPIRVLRLRWLIAQRERIDAAGDRVDMAIIATRKKLGQPVRPMPDWCPIASRHLR